MKHSNPVKNAVWFIKEIVAGKPQVINSANSKEEYCEHHAIKDYYCEMN
ncbi:hypothetical protein R3X25_03880 [Lutibacter sp. TH_r2]|nr:hypothetical protein [Lutibacter sp. TH_r2]MDV7186411.1 hypothetical protein [Lutibacter sp. TH_r2]